MNRNAMLCLVLGIFLTSCSTDQMADASADAILGTWELTALDINEGQATTEEEFAQDILNILSASDCYLLTLTFNEDLTLDIQDATNYLELGVDGLGTGLEVPCPTQRDTFTTTYTYADGVLIFVDENRQSVSAEVSISGNVMVISARQLDVENFNTGGELLFSRR